MGPIHDRAKARIGELELVESSDERLQRLVHPGLAHVELFGEPGPLDKAALDLGR